MPEREKSVGELADDVEKLGKAVDTLNRTVIDGFAALRKELERTYVRADVHRGVHDLIDERLAGVRDDLDEQAESLMWARRIAVTSLALPILVAVVVWVILQAGAT